MREHSKEAWAIASRYSNVLASESRDLAAAIDAAIEKARGVPAQGQPPGDLVTLADRLEYRTAGISRSHGGGAGNLDFLKATDIDTIIAALRFVALPAEGQPKCAAVSVLTPKQKASEMLFGDAKWLDDPMMVNQMDDKFTDDTGNSSRRITPNELIAELESADRQSPAESAPQGWKLVPIVPDQKMIESGCDNNPRSWNEGIPNGFAADVANDVYVSMVRAAPECSSQPDSVEIAKIVSIWSEIAPGTKKAIQEEHYMLAECLDKLVKGDGK